MIIKEIERLTVFRGTDPVTTIITITDLDGGEHYYSDHPLIAFELMDCNVLPALATFIKAFNELPQQTYYFLLQHDRELKPLLYTGSHKQYTVVCEVFREETGKHAE